MSGVGNKATSFFHMITKIAFIVILATLLLLAAKYSFQYGQRVFSEEGYAQEPGVDLTIEVPVGTSMLEFSKLLEEYGVVEDYKIFYLQTIIYEAKTVQAGTYTFNNSLGGEALINIVKAGPEEASYTAEEQ